MKITKSTLRECARLALEQRGFIVEPVHGSGIVRGARLRAKRNKTTRTVAVRTSLDREVGLTRNSDGRWATIPRMDEVLVAVPAQQQREMAEILSFDPEVLIESFDKALQARRNQNPDFKLKSPIFLRLDDGKNGDNVHDIGLIAKSEWRTLIPLASVPRHSAPRQESESEFFERIRREFAERFGMDFNKVSVTFQVSS